MPQQLMQKIPRLVLAFLLSVGLSLSLLGGLGLSYSLPGVCLTVLCGCVLLEAVSWSRRTLLWGSLGLAAACLVWLAGGGLPTAADLLRALTLQIAGIPGALPLMAREAALLFPLALSLLGFLCSRPRAGALGACLLTLAALLLLWLADRADLLPWLLPAGIAAVCLLLMERHQEVSFFRIVPWVAGIFLLALALTPRPGVILPELKERVDSLRQSVMDRLFFTEPREVFSLSSEGFYPQGSTRLGGPVTPSDHPVMQVSTPRTAYLRGVLMNEYDGRTWRNTLGGRRYLWDSAGVSAQRAQLFDEQRPEAALASSLLEPSDISVRMLSEGASTLFVPQRIRDLRAGGGLVPYFTNSSEIFITRNLIPGDTWSLSAPLLQAGDPGLSTLISAAASLPDAQYDAVRETYTVLPGHLEEPVWQMARDVTDGLSSPYEKAFALQNYLSRNYRYSLDVAAQPANIDFVTHFLFQTREGYCTYFASAMTVLCRMAGLPARYVEGYLAQPGASGEALVTGMNAHAWTEVYFRGFGWLTLDATPHRMDTGDSAAPTLSPEPVPTSADYSPTPPPPAEVTATPPPEGDGETVPPDGTPDPSASPAPGQEVSPGNPTSPFPWLLLLLLAALPALAGLLRWQWTSPARRDRKASSESARFDLWLRDVLDRLAAAGYPRQRGETLMTYTRRLEEAVPTQVSLGQLGECASLLHYGRVQALPTDTALARDAARQLKKALPRKARLRYALRRLGFSRKKRTPVPPGPEKA